MGSIVPTCGAKPVHLLIRQGPWWPANVPFRARLPLVGHKRALGNDFAMVPRSRSGRSKPVGGLAQVSGRETAKAGERPERKEGAIAVIAQIKDAWEADRVVPWLIPGAVAILALDQIGDAPGDRGIVRLAG